MVCFNSKAVDWSDCYGTPEYAIAMIRDRIPPGIVWECCAGYGAITDDLRKHGREVIATDVKTGHNALKWQPERFDCIVTNPPYSLKTEFLARCFELGKPFALLVPTETLVSKKRTPLFAKHVDDLALVIPGRRINFNRFDGKWPKGKRSSANCSTSWFCWKFNLPPLSFVIEGLP